MFAQLPRGAGEPLLAGKSGARSIVLFRANVHLSITNVMARLALVVLIMIPDSLQQPPSGKKGLSFRGRGNNIRATQQGQDRGEGEGGRRDSRPTGLGFCPIGVKCGGLWFLGSLFKI